MCSGELISGDGSHRGALCRFFPIRLWHVESIARDTGGQELHQYLRGPGRSVAGDPEAHSRGTAQRKRQ